MLAARPRVWRSPCLAKTPTVAQQRKPGPDGSNEKRNGDGDGKSRRSDDSAASSTGGSSQLSSRGLGARLAKPNDSPLRDLNRARLLGLLTDRATHTLMYYFMELNPTLHNWLYIYLQENPIPKSGEWRDVSGETFIRKLLGSPLAEARYNFGGRDAMFSCATPIGVDPRSIAQRIMEIRAQIAKEWVEELRAVSEENALLMRETLVSSFSLNNIAVMEASGVKSTHPEMQGIGADGPDNSAIGDDD